MQAQLEQLVQDDAMRPNSAALVNKLYSTTRRLSRLHYALTLLSTTENQQLRPAVPVRLDQVVEDKTHQLEKLAAARNLTLSVVVIDVPVLAMHPSLAVSLVQNLLRNAVKHSSRGGHIQVSMVTDALGTSNSGLERETITFR